MAESSQKVWSLTKSDREEMARAYAAQGYLILDLELPNAMLDDCEAVTRGFLGQYSRVQDGYRRFEPIRKLGAYQPVLELLAELYGRKPIPFQTLNFATGTEQGSHADNIFFNSDPPAMMCGLWVALEDISPDSGPLHYYPGSHKRDVVLPADVDATHDGDLYARFQNEARNFDKRTAVLKRGQAILWSANLLHGGEAIAKPGTTRLSQVTHYYFENCVYTSPTVRGMDGSPHIRFPFDFAAKRYVLSRDPKTGRIVWPHWRYAAGAFRSRLIKRIITQPVAPERAPETPKSAD